MNPTTILEKLDSADIRRRLDDLDRERRALLTLLRAAQNRERGVRRAGRSHKEVRDAR